jgi:multisubunit Na+/H+ antiporter MnhC subunit
MKNNVMVYMGFELAVLLLTGAFVYLKLIPNDLLILALGVVIRGALTVIPTIGALTQNTAATRENTAATATVAQVVADAPPPVKHTSVPKT